MCLSISQPLDTYQDTYRMKLYSQVTLLFLSVLLILAALLTSLKRLYVLRMQVCLQDTGFVLYSSR